MEKHSEEEAQTWRKSEMRRSDMEKLRHVESEKRENAGARKGRKVAKQCFFFPLVCRLGRSKNRIATAAGAEPFGEMRNLSREHESERAGRFTLYTQFVFKLKIH